MVGGESPRRRPGAMSPAPLGIANRVRRWYHSGLLAPARCVSKGNPIRTMFSWIRHLPAAIVFLAVICFFPDPVAARGSPGKVLVRGTVINEEGQPIAGVTVRLLKTRTLIRPGKMSLEDQVVEGARTVTDRHGMFEMELDRDRSYERYFVRFYDSKTFDSVQFQLPEDREVTKKWKRRRPIVVTQVLQHSPDWAEIQEWIARYGASSGAARILRALGLPERIDDSEGNDRVEWCYDGEGICYHLVGSEVLGQDRTSRTVPPPPEEG